MRLLLHACNVFLPLGPSSFEWIFASRMSCIYRHILCWVWVEILVYFPKLVQLFRERHAQAAWRCAWGALQCDREKFCLGRVSHMASASGEDFRPFSSFFQCFLPPTCSWGLGHNVPNFYVFKDFLKLDNFHFKDFSIMNQMSSKMTEKHTKINLRWLVIID